VLIKELPGDGLSAVVLELDQDILEAAVMSSSAKSIKEYSEYADCPNPHLSVRRVLPSRHAFLGGSRFEVERVRVGQSSVDIEENRCRTEVKINHQHNESFQMFIQPCEYDQLEWNVW